MKYSLDQILDMAMAECIPPPNFDKKPEKQVFRKAIKPLFKKAILKKKASKKSPQTKPEKPMKKPALIDLDVIEKAIKHNRFENLRESAIVAAEIFEFVKADCSQPALIELLKSAIRYGIVFGIKNSESDSMDLTPAFHNFLTQNNLTDEKI